MALLSVQIHDSMHFSTSGLKKKKPFAMISADTEVQQRSCKCNNISSLTKSSFMVLFLYLEGQKGPSYIKDYIINLHKRSFCLSESVAFLCKA